MDYIYNVIVICIAILGFTFIGLFFVVAVIAFFLTVVANFSIVVALLLNTIPSINIQTTNMTYPCDVNVIYKNAFPCSILTLWFEVCTWVIIFCILIAIIVLIILGIGYLIYICVK